MQSSITSSHWLYGKPVGIKIVAKIIFGLLKVSQNEHMYGKLENWKLQVKNAKDSVKWHDP